jgi:hypothetical protein
MKLLVCVGGGDIRVKINNLAHQSPSGEAASPSAGQENPTLRKCAPKVPPLATLLSYMVVSSQTIFTMHIWIFLSHVCDIFQMVSFIHISRLQHWTSFWYVLCVLRSRLISFPLIFIALVISSEGCTCKFAPAVLSSVVFINSSDNVQMQTEGAYDNCSLRNTGVCFF